MGYKDQGKSPTHCIIFLALVTAQFYPFSDSQTHLFCQLLRSEKLLEVEILKRVGDG